MTSLSSEPLFAAPATRWRVSAAWLVRLHECNLAGIQARCGGACCYGPYWPASSYNEGGLGPCGNLGPQGCTLTDEVKPVTCHLYPLRLSRTGQVVLHNRATTERGICKGNHGRGPMLIDALRDNLVALFGAEQYERVRASVVAGQDSYFEVPPEVLARLEHEHELEALGLRPV